MDLKINMVTLYIKQKKKDDVMKPDEIGEATLYTAIAAIAIATVIISKMTGIKILQIKV